MRDMTPKQMNRASNILAILTLALVVSGAALYFGGYVPGTIKKDSDGFIRGTGKWLHHYKSGDVMLEEHYFAGRLQSSRWFRPDGSLVAETRWRSGDGVGFFLRQDGTIRAKMEFRNERAHGTATYFLDDGVTVERVAEFRDGVEVAVAP
jgi:antitoxin component YwqK of YwqJK toxin-antitoxin module